MADTKTGLFQKLMENPQVMKMAEQMFNSMGPEGQLGFAQGAGKGMGMLNEAGDALALGDQGIMGAMNAQGGINASQLGSLALGAAKAHPFKTAGLIGAGAGNIGGLMDNDKFGGQLAGLGLGGLGAYALAQGNPYLAAMMTMGGGSLGALFDKLRARKELEEQQGYANAGNPFAMTQR
jgi:hypothetical protein